MRELKLSIDIAEGKGGDCRTPPGVRELKLLNDTKCFSEISRTPPGVRELKLMENYGKNGKSDVAPLPGCVN